MIKWIIEIIAKTVTGDFYGEITFKFAKGKATNCKIETSEKPPLDLEF
jgi:hypothetical protein